MVTDDQMPLWQRIAILEGCIIGSGLFAWAIRAPKIGSVMLFAILYYAHRIKSLPLGIALLIGSLGLVFAILFLLEG